ncbi:hypothetical protein, partial [Clavibacter michiganensis]|uniref:hypothetical protein n=1 Tax=Clavibacter michiganensis TaxID=28447 RepID=UPI002931C461
PARAGTDATRATPARGPPSSRGPPGRSPDQIVVVPAPPSGLLAHPQHAEQAAVGDGAAGGDRGLFGVFMVGEKASRVGELDEEMVYELSLIHR